MIDKCIVLKCENCGISSKQPASSGIIYEDTGGIFYVYDKAKCPGCNTKFNSNRAKKAKKVEVFR